eukprot:4371768-Amphidinium_carterae.2
MDPNVAPATHTAWVSYVDADRDVEHWRPLLTQALEILSSRSSWLPDPSTSFWQTVSKLVPWTLRRVAVARTPKVRRFDADLPHTQRCSTSSRRWIHRGRDH